MNKLEKSALNVSSSPHGAGLKNLMGFHRLIVPVVFILLVFLFFPSRGKFELSSDEGINLIKALMVEKGYALYDEIWSDQPPLLTHLLALSLQLFGVKVAVARNVIFAISLGLVWAATEWMAMFWKRPYAYATALLFFLLPSYLSLSLSVMVGLPSIAFALFALFCLTLWHTQHRYLWLILSAILLSLAVLTKLMIGFLAPIFGVGLLIDAFFRFRATRKWQDLLIPAGVWSGVFVGLLGIGLYTLVGFENMPQLLEDHLSATASAFYAADPTLNIHYHLRNAWPFLFLAGVGTLFAVRMRHWTTLYLTAWALTAYLLLLNHLPVWSHHPLYITVPGAMLGGIAVVEGLKLFRASARTPVELKTLGGLRGVALLGTLYLALLIPQTEPFQVLSWPPTPKTTGLEVGARVERVLATMSDYAPQTNWVFTDSPMFAFRARLAVPPELAVTTDKRIRTGLLTDAQILDIIIAYQPEQVLLGRFTLPGLDEYLAENYRIVARKEDFLILYIRNDLKTP
ncbi:MAG: phospholipid carrier-dependent glycosyltransferase [Anaerolineales bacterium]|nr:phospholipid carrier-dependent glycosyltransferase [Anaerolineales bacterium]